LVADRLDFLVVYVASLASMLALLFGARVVQFSSAPLSDLLLPVGVGALLCLMPPAIAAVVPSGRRSVQVLFGAALLPIVAAIAINGWSVIRALGE
jgi:hypothetical protein